MAEESVLKVGTSEGCDIRLGDTQEPERILAMISVDEKGLVVLCPASQGVVCKVNGNRIASQYWIKSGDEVIIDGFRLDVGQVMDILAGLGVKVATDSVGVDRRNRLYNGMPEEFDVPKLYGPPSMMKDHIRQSQRTPEACIYGPPPTKR